MNINGSDIFDTVNIKTDEYILLAKVGIENGSTVEQADKDIRLIDDLLQLQKVQIIISGNRRTVTGRLRKDSAMLDFMERRIEQEINTK